MFFIISSIFLPYLFFFIIIKLDKDKYTLNINKFNVQSYIQLY